MTDFTNTQPISLTMGPDAEAFVNLSCPSVQTRSNFFARLCETSEFHTRPTVLVANRLAYLEAHVTLSCLGGKWRTNLGRSSRLDRVHSAKLSSAVCSRIRESDITIEARSDSVGGLASRLTQTMTLMLIQICLD